MEADGDRPSISEGAEGADGLDAANSVPTKPVATRRHRKVTVRVATDAGASEADISTDQEAKPPTALPTARKRTTKATKQEINEKELAKEAKPATTKDHELKPGPKTKSKADAQPVASATTATSPAASTSTLLDRWVTTKQLA